MCPNRMIRRCC